MKKLIKYGVSLILLTIGLSSTNVKANMLKGYTGELYVEGNIYEGTPLQEVNTEFALDIRKQKQLNLVELKRNILERKDNNNIFI